MRATGQRWKAIMLRKSAISLRKTGLLVTVGLTIANVARAQVAGPSPSSNAITISTPSNPSAAPFQSLTIRGSGFDPSVHTSVTFSDGGHYSVSVPTFLVTSSMVMVTVPPYLAPGGALRRGVVAVTVDQVSSTGVVSSNTINGFEIQAPPELAPEVSTGLPPGSLSLAVLEAVLQTNSNLQSEITGTAFDTPQMQNTLSDQTAILQTIIPQIQSVVSGMQAEVDIGQLNGTEITISSHTLHNTDRLLLSFVTVIAGPWPDLSPFGTSSDPRSTPNPIQLAAQDVLAFLTPQTLANFVNSFAQANPDQACAFAVIGAGVLGTAIAIDTMGLPAVVLAAQLALYNADLLESATLSDIVTAVGGSILEYCAEGLNICGNITAFLRDVAKNLFLGETKGEWFEIWEDTVNIRTILEQRGCGPALNVSPSNVTLYAPGGLNFVTGLSVASSGTSIPWTATTSDTWIGMTHNILNGAFSPSITGTTPGSFFAAVTNGGSGVLGGFYNGSIKVSSPSASNSPITVPVKAFVAGPFYFGSWTLTYTTPCAAPAGASLTTTYRGSMFVQDVNFTSVSSFAGFYYLNLTSYSYIGCTSPPPASGCAGFGCCPSCGSDTQAEGDVFAQVGSNGSVSTMLGIPFQFIGSCSTTVSGTLSAFSGSGSCNIPAATSPGTLTFSTSASVSPTGP